MRAIVSNDPIVVKRGFEAQRGIEPLHRGFADRSVSTSPSGR